MPRNYAPWGHRFFPNAAVRGSSRLHYLLLPDRLRRHYTVFESALLNGRSCVSLNGVTDSSEILAITNSVFMDNPLFCEYGINKSFMVNNTTRTSNLRIDRIFAPEEFKEHVRRIESKVQWFRDRTSGMGTYEKELFVHDELAKNITYDLEERNQFNMIGPLIHGRGSCLGISSATMYILNRLGVDTGILSGCMPGNRVGHAWNLVNLDDGKNYHLDVTFDCLGKGEVIHSFFNVDDSSVVDAKHIWNEKVACSATAYSYHTMNGSYVDDINDIPDVVRRLTKDTDTIEMKLSRRLSRKIDRWDLIRIVTKATGKTVTNYSCYECNNSYRIAVS